MAQETTLSEEKKNVAIMGVIGWFGSPILIGVGTGSVFVGIGVFLAIMTVGCMIEMMKPENTPE